MAILFGCVSAADRGDQAARRGNWDAAIQEYQIAYAEEPTPALKSKLDNAIQQRIQQGLSTAQLAVRDENFDLAVTEYNRVLQLDPNNSVASAGISDAQEGRKRVLYRDALSEARSEFGKQRLAIALNHLRKAIETYEKNDEAKQLLDTVSQEMKRAEESITEAQQFLQAREWTQARAAFQRAKTIWSDNPTALAGIETAQNHITYDSRMVEARTHLNAQPPRYADARASLLAARTAVSTPEVNDEIRRVESALYQQAMSAAQDAVTRARNSAIGSDVQLEAFSQAIQHLGKAKQYTEGPEYRELRESLSRDDARRLADVGQRASQEFDFDIAERTLKIAKLLGADVGGLLNDVQYQKHYWQGIRAEVENQREVAIRNYQDAKRLGSRDEVEIALTRLSNLDALLPQNQVPEILANASAQRKQQVETALRQVGMLETFRNYNALENNDIDAREFGNPQLGNGIDIVTNKRVSGSVPAIHGRTQTVSGVYSDNYFSREVSKVATKSESFNISLGLTFKIYGIPISPSIEHSSNSAETSFEYKLEIYQEVIISKEILTNISLDSSAKQILSFDDWRSRYGTHYVSEVWRGGRLTITITRKFESVDEAKAWGGGIDIGILRAKGGASWSKLKADSKLEIEISQTGAPNFRIPTINASSDLEKFFDLRNGFISAVRESGGDVLKMRIARYQSVPEFPIPSDRFANAIKRVHGNEISSFVVNSANNAAEVIRYENRIKKLSAEENRRIQIKNEIQNKLTGRATDLQANQVYYLPVDLSNANYPDSIRITSASIRVTNGWSDNYVRIHLIPPPAWRIATQEIARMQQPRVQQLGADWLWQESILKRDTKRDKGEWRLSSPITLQKGIYGIYIVNDNRSAAGTIDYSFTVGDN